MCKLTDFTAEQLDTLSMAVANRLNDHDEIMKSYKKYQLSEFSGFRKAYDQAKKEVENCEAILIQLLNAKQIVSDRETITSN